MVDDFYANCRNEQLYSGSMDMAYVKPRGKHALLQQRARGSAPDIQPPEAPTKYRRVFSVR